MTRVGDFIDNQYEVLSLIGEGGMSRVWLVRDSRLNKLWAIKEIGRSSKDANNQVVIQSLIAEAHLMKRLEHPALPRIKDIVEDGKTIYVVMDYVEGASLKETLKQRGRPLDAETVVSCGVQLCDALEYLHTQTPPIVYRDMKPGNVMMREDGTVKLIDFGIAREYKEDRSSDTQILGTKGYAAPEQWSKTMQTDARTDIYSLGVTLYHLVTGRGPNDDPVFYPIRQIDPSLPEGLEHIILKAVQQDPGDRYQSCAEMRYDLEHYEKLTQEYRSVQEAKLIRFYRLCAAAVGCLLAGILCLGLSFYFRNSSYDSLIGQAEAASIESADDEMPDAERFYRAAIDVMPTALEPYEDIVERVYKADNNFTTKEAERWASLYESHRADIESTDGYAKLCNDIGILYYVYFELRMESDGERVYDSSAKNQAAAWFKRAVTSYEDRTDAGQNCTLTEAEYRAAKTHRTIGEFYSTLSASVEEGTEGEQYTEYWKALNDGFDDMSQTGEDEDTAVKMRLYQLIAETVESPTHLQALKSAGVEKSDISNEEESGLYDKVVNTCKSQQVENAASRNEKTRQMREDILDGQKAVKETIRKVYGNAATVAVQRAQDQIAQSGAGEA